MTTVCLLVLVADSLGSGIVGTSQDAVGEYLLADEGWHGDLVVLKTGCRVVGSAGAVVAQVIRSASVEVDFTTAESTASVGLALAPLGSGSERNGGWVNGRVAGLRDSEAGKQRDSNSRLEEHLDGLEGDVDFGK